MNVVKSRNVWREAADILRDFSDEDGLNSETSSRVIVTLMLRHLGNKY